MKKLKEPLFAAAFLLTAALLLNFASDVLRPVHPDYGSTWQEYLCEPEDSIDVLFLGSSFAYCSWNPGVIYDESGLTGYVMGGSEQTPAITYWYLREALRTQSPSAVVLEGTSLFFDRYMNYTQQNLVYMPWGMNRARAILECAEPELKTGLFFDLYFYHDRWKEHTSEDVKRVMRTPQADLLKGHTAVETVFDQLDGGPWVRDMEQSEEVYAQNLQDFSRIDALCREKGIPLIVTINPTYSPFTQEVYDRLEQDLKNIDPSVEFYNWSGSFEEIGIDVTQQLYDNMHLNYRGAYIFSRWTGQFLLDWGLTPRPQTPENTKAWADTAAYWNSRYEEKE